MNRLKTRVEGRWARIVWFFAILLLPLHIFAQNKITASVTITNLTVNGLTFTVNGDTRTWTNNVVNAATQVLTNADTTGCGSKTNLLSQIRATPFSQVVSVDTGSNTFNLVGNSGLAISLSLSGTYGKVSYTTQTVAQLIALVGPVSAIPTAGGRTNVASDIVGGINAPENTNQISQIATAAAQLVGTTNSQTINGQKNFSNSNNVYFGKIVDSPSIGGSVSNLTGGYWSNGIVDSSTLQGNSEISITNHTPSAPTIQIYDADASDLFYIFHQAQIAGIGIADSFVGITNHSEIDLRNDGGGIDYLVNTTTGNLSGAHHSFFIQNIERFGITTNGVSSTLFSGNAGGLTNINAGALTNAIPPGPLSGATITNATLLGMISMPANSDIVFARKSISSLANGNNAAIPIGTNVFIEVSGPSGSFAINGIANGRDGKVIFILNQSGFQMTIANESGTDPTAANRIRTLGAATDLVLTNALVQLIYSGNNSRWIVMGHNP